MKSFTAFSSQRIKTLHVTLFFSVAPGILYCRGCSRHCHFNRGLNCSGRFTNTAMQKSFGRRLQFYTQ